MFVAAPVFLSSFYLMVHRLVTQHPDNLKHSAGVLTRWICIVSLFFQLQVANLLQTDDGRVAVSQYRDIQQSLVRSRQQNQSLLQKLNEYEGKMNVKVKAMFA